MVNPRYYLTYLIVLGMESCCFYAIINAANKSVADILSVPLLLIILLISFALSRGLRLIRLPRPVTAVIGWILWALVTLLTVKIQLFPGTALNATVWLTAIPTAISKIFISFEPALLILIASAFLWWAGRRLAYLKIDFAATVTEFQFGLVLLVIVVFTAYMLKLDQSSSIPITLIFFSLGLIGISISHSANLSQPTTSLHSRNWIWILLFSIGVILILGFLVSLVITPDFIHWILKGLKWIWSLIEKFFAFLSSLIPQSSEPIPEPTETVSGTTGQDSGLGFTLPEWLRPGLQTVWIVLVLGLVGFALWRVTSDIFNWLRQHSSSAGGEIESLKGAFRRDLLNWFKKLLSRIFGIKFATLIRSKQSQSEIGSVRQLYRQVLHWGTQKGAPRKNSQTPVEYLNTLNSLLPENREELAIITHEYMQARYGTIVLADTETNLLKEKWNKIRKLEPGRRKIKPEKK